MKHPEQYAWLSTGYLSELKDNSSDLKVPQEEQTQQAAEQAATMQAAAAVKEEADRKTKAGITKSLTDGPPLASCQALEMPQENGEVTR